MTHGFCICRVWICEFAYSLKCIRHLKINTVALPWSFVGVYREVNILVPPTPRVHVPFGVFALCPFCWGTSSPWVRSSLFGATPAEPTSQVSSEACQRRVAETLSL